MKIEPPAPPQKKPEASPQGVKPERPTSLQALVQRIAPNNEKTVQAQVQSDSVPIKNPEGSRSGGTLFKVLIKIGSVELMASSPVALKKGQMLGIDLVAGKGLVIRSIDNPDNDASHLALRNLSPIQEDLAPLLKLLQHNSAVAPSSRAQKEASLQQQLEQHISALLSKLPSLEQLKYPQQMRLVLLQSGLFHEQQLKLLTKNAEPNNSRKHTGHDKSSGDALNLVMASETKTPLESPPINLDLKSLLKRFHNDLNQLKQLSQNTTDGDETTPQKNNKKDTALAEDLLKPSVSTNTSFLDKSPKTSTNTPQAPHAQQLAKLLTSTTALPNSTANTAPTTSATYWPPLSKLNTGLPAQTPYTSALNRSAGKERIEKVIETLMQQTAGVLAKIQLNQLASLDHSRQGVTETNTTQQWLFELPLNTGTHMEVVTIHIKEKEQKSRDKEQRQEKSWQVDLGFDLGELGKVHIEFRLINQSANSIIWADNAQTYSRINDQVNNLQQTLENIGVHVERIDCRQGKVPDRTPLRITSRLIDITT
jgi:hypothetical protein